MVWVMLKTWQPMNDNNLRFHTLADCREVLVSEIPYGHVPAVVPLVNLSCMATVHFGQVLPLVPACGPSQKWKGSWGGGTSIPWSQQHSLLCNHMIFVCHTFQRTYHFPHHHPLQNKVFHHVLCHTILCKLWLKGEPQEQRYANESGTIWSYGWRDKQKNNCCHTS